MRHGDLADRLDIRAVFFGKSMIVIISNDHRDLNFYIDDVG